MTINVQELLDKGYKKFSATRFGACPQRAYQKRVENEKGDVLYFLNAYMYYDYGIHQATWEIEVQLYQKGTHEPVNLKFFCGWALSDVEDYARRIYEVGFEPYEDD